MRISHNVVRYYVVCGIILKYALEIATCYIVATNGVRWTGQDVNTSAIIIQAIIKHRVIRRLAETYSLRIIHQIIVRQGRPCGIEQRDTIHILSEFAFDYCRITDADK